jgi:hypothetical protein
MLHEKTFCKCLIGSVNVATAHQDDVDEAMGKCKASVLTLDRHSKVGPEELSRKWNIGLEMVKATLDMMTQHGVQTVVHPMLRWLRVDHLHLHRPRLKGTWYLDTLIANIKSLLGNKCANVFTNGKYMKVVPMASQKEAAELLIDFTDDVSILETLVMDGATEFTGKHTDFIKQARQMWIKLDTAEQGRKNQNHVAEWEIKFLSKHWKLRMEKKKLYSWLWDYGLVYEGELLTRMSHGYDGRSGYEQILAKLPISVNCLTLSLMILYGGGTDLTNQTLMMRQNDWEDGLAYLTI